MNYYYDCEFLEGTQEERWHFKLKEKTWYFILVAVYLILALLDLYFTVKTGSVVTLVLAIGWILCAFFNYQYILKNTFVTKPTIDLISIGIVAEDGREYYAISKDFNLEEAWNRFDLVKKKRFQTDYSEYTEKVYWIRENVLKPIYKELKEKQLQELGANLVDFCYSDFKHLINKYGKTNKQIAEEVKEFVYEGCECKGSIEFGECKTKHTFYGYYSAYDHVALCWLFGKMIDLPKGFPMYTKDLKQSLDLLVNNINALQLNSKGIILIGDIKSMSFETKLEIVKSFEDYPKQAGEHNALADARWNRELHKFIINNSITFNVIPTTRSTSTYLSKVEEFHVNFEAPVLDIRKTAISNERCELRLNLILEELHELAISFGKEDYFMNKLTHLVHQPRVDPMKVGYNPVECLDALCDLQYVLSGTILEVGFKNVFESAFDEVHYSNMTKVVSTEEEVIREVKLFDNKTIQVNTVKNKAGNYYFKRKDDGKIIKPSTYRKADLNRVLKQFLKENA